MNTENATDGWILNVYDNPYDAWLTEQICAYKFGIPQITWTYKKSKNRKINVDKLYNELGDLTLKAAKCLEFFR